MAGSTRAESLNRKLALAARQAASDLGLDATHIELRDYPLPIYDGDHESQVGTPPAVVALRTLLKRHDVWLIASPNYNNSISPLLKNVIDWVSRPTGGDGYVECFKNRVVIAMSSSDGSSGGARGLPHLRQILAHLGARVLDEQFTVPRGSTAFDAAGGLVDLDQRRQLQRLIGAALDAVVRPGAELAGFHAA